MVAVQEAARERQCDWLLHLLSQVLARQMSIQQVVRGRCVGWQRSSHSHHLSHAQSSSHSQGQPSQAGV
jgi:hypothetical protein